MQNTFTVHMLKTYSECPKKYEFAYVKKLRIPEDTRKTQTGNKLHNLINFRLKGQDISKLIPLLDEKELKLWENYLSINPGEYVDSEFAFLAKCSDVWLSGRIDALYKNEDGILIADWKTSDYILKEKDNFQTMFYLYAVYNIFKEKGVIKDFSQVSLTYFVLSDNTQITVRLTSQLYEEFCKQIEILDRKISSAEFQADESDSCKLCSYQGVCHKQL